MKGFTKFLSSIFDPFELLYLAIAAATFAHTQWAAAFLFEGPQPTGEADLAQWYFSGTLIAIAVDVGMLLTSRFLQDSKHRGQIIILTIAFAVAAIVSFFTQFVYIGYHTPLYVLSDGVSEYWRPVMEKIIDARVLLFPLALPTLAAIYTLARIYRHKEQVVNNDHLRTVEEVAQVQQAITTAIKQPDFKVLISAVRKRQTLLNSGKDVVESGQYSVDLRALTWQNENGKVYGPYKNEAVLIASLSMARKRRQEELLINSQPKLTDGK